MTVHVLIERDSAGRLHGYVQERRTDGWVVKGEDMLTRNNFRSVDAAVEECDRRILEAFKLIEPPRIVYVLPGDQEER